MASYFSRAALTFLRGLKRHNDRDWFNERKAVFERDVKLPMLALIDEINLGLDEFAPEHVRPAAKCMMRIYRDIRFSKDKRPYKAQVEAWWARNGLEKTSGAGFYLQVNATEVVIAAGAYMPERDQTLAIRRHLLEHHEQARALLALPELTALMQPIDGMKLTRAPKGFPADSPALDLLLQRQWVIASTLPAEAALEHDFQHEVMKRFRLAAPFVNLLNAPLISTSRKPLF